MENDLERRSLLLAVGECLHAWSGVEVELSNLYMILHGIKRDEFDHPTRAAFEAVNSLEVRLAMLVAYVTADLSIRDRYLPHVKALNTQVFKLYKKRHEVAHFMVVGRQRKTGRVQPIIRPFFTVDVFQQQRGTELDLDQVTQRVGKIGDLSELIRSHVQHVGALRKLPLEYYVRAGDRAFPPLGREDLTPEGLQPPPPPSPA